MSDTTTPAAPAPDLQGLSQDQINQLLASLHLGQGLPNVQPDQTPVDSSGFGGGLRHVVSLLGEFAGSPGPETLKALSPAEREQAGIQALSRFGTGLLQASGSGKWIGTNLGNAFATAERGYDTTTKQALGMLAAKQGYAVEDQRAQIERLKAALPLLSLKQKLDAINALPATLSGTVAPGASIAAGGSIAPFVATNLPEGVTTAEDQIVRTVLGEAANQGTVGQQAVAAVIKNRMDTGKQNAQDVIFSANQFEPWNNPKTRADLEKIDPTSKQYQDVLNNAVRPVMSGSAKDPTSGATHFWSPTAQAALGREPPSWAAGQTPTVIGQHNFYKLPYGATASAPGQTAAAPAMAPVGTKPADTKISIPPAAAPNAARPSLPPPEAPMAGTAQTAGPAAPTGNVIPPSPAGSPAALADIISGMVARGADPTTLAPGRGSAPAPMPGAVVTAQAAPPAPPPDSFEAYKLAHPITPDDTQRSLFNPQPDATQLQRLEEQKKNAEQLYQAARRGADPAAAVKAREDYQAIIDKENTLRENARKLGVETQAKYLAEQEKQRFDAWTAEQKQRADIETEARKQTNAIDLARITTEFDKEKEGAKIAMRGDEQRMLKTGEAAAAMAPVSEQLRQLPALMRQLPPGGLISSLLGQYPPLARALETAGIINPGTADNVSVFTGLTNHLATQLRVSGTGSMSDRDLDTFKSVVPRLLESEAGRAKAVAFLQNMVDRVVQGQEFTQDYFRRVDPATGKPAHNLSHLSDAINAPRKLDENGINRGGLGPVLPAAPRFDGPKGYAAAQAWLRENVQSGHPYTAWLRDETGKITQQILVRE